MKTEVIHRGLVKIFEKILKWDIKPLIKTLSNALNNNYYPLNVVVITYKNRILKFKQ